MKYGFIFLFLFLSITANGQEPWFVTDIASGQNNHIVVTCKTDKSVKTLNPNGWAVLKSSQLKQTPSGVAVDGVLAYVTCFDTHGELVVVDLDKSAILHTIAVGSGASAPTINKQANKIYVCNTFSGVVSEIDLAQMKVSREVRVLREPSKAIVSKDGRLLFVLNALPAQRADVDYVASEVSVIDLATFKKIKDIKLENGSNALHGASLSADGRYLFVVHNLGRFTVPTSQLQQGWMNTNAMSVVDVATLEFGGAVLLDEPERGAAGAWGVQCTPEHLVVSHSGTHEISVIDYPLFIKKYEAHPDKTTLNYDLRFLYGIRERVALMGNGPRNFIIQGEKVIVPTYFSDDINMYDLNSRTCSNVSLNPQRTENEQQRGERIFNDGSYCFQSWQSCTGCHPSDARTDGMNWDLMNDGVGNSKNCKSLLLSIQTPPSMITGIRASGRVANRAGFKFIQFMEIKEDDAQAIDAYIAGLQPVPSPYLVDGALSAKAVRGRKVFDKLNCGECHSGPYYTDLKMYRIGEDVEFENGWDTPTLIEVWRTAPYLFDGRAATLEDVFRLHKHGIERKISSSEISDMVEYINSL